LSGDRIGILCGSNSAPAELHFSISSLRRRSGAVKATKAGAWRDSHACGVWVGDVLKKQAGLSRALIFLTEIK